MGRKNVVERQYLKTLSYNQIQTSYITIFVSCFNILLFCLSITIKPSFKQDTMLSPSDPAQLNPTLPDPAQSKPFQSVHTKPIATHFNPVLIIQKQLKPTQINPNPTQPNATQANPTQPNPSQCNPTKPSPKPNPIQSNLTQPNSIQAQPNQTYTIPTRPNKVQPNPTQHNPT